MGLNHMNGRVEDSIVGRFLSPDPHGINPYNTQSYNRYSYVNNNPMTLIDPTGFQQVKLVCNEYCSLPAGVSRLSPQVQQRFLSHLGFTRQSFGDAPGPSGNLGDGGLDGLEGNDGTLGSLDLNPDPGVTGTATPGPLGPTGDAPATTNAGTTSGAAATADAGTTGGGAQGTSPAPTISSTTHNADGTVATTTFDANGGTTTVTTSPDGKTVTTTTGNIGVNPSPNDTGITAADLQDPEFNQARDQAIAQSQADLSTAGNMQAQRMSQGNYAGVNYWKAQGYYAVASYYQWTNLPSLTLYYSQLGQQTCSSSQTCTGP